MKKITTVLVILLCILFVIPISVQNAEADDDSTVSSDVYGHTDDGPILYSNMFFASENDDFLTFKYENFSQNVDKLILNNKAMIENDELVLTPSQQNNWGSAFNKEKVSLKDERSFSTYFSFILSNIVGTYSPYTGGDGIVFTVQTAANDAGSGGGGLGYTGISPSIGIEFDTFPNNEHGDSGSNHHVAINKNGVTNAPLVIAEINKSVTDLHVDGKEHHVWIDYNGKLGIIEVRISDNITRPDIPIISLDLGPENRLTSILSADEVYVGFTAATGGNRQKHRITSWYFTNKFSPIDVENNLYKQAPDEYELTTAELEDGTVELTITAKNHDKEGVPLTIISNNGAIVTPSTTSTDSSGVATVILSSPDGSEMTTTITVQDPGGVFPSKIVTIPGRSAPPLPENIVANSTQNQVTVSGVPVDGTVKVYRIGNVLIGTVLNSDGDKVVVDIDDNEPLVEGETIYVTFTEKDRIESIQVPSTVKAESSKLNEDQVTANATTGTVTVTDVPVDATIIVRDKDNNELGQATNAGPGSIVVVDELDLEHEEDIQVTIIEKNKLESEPVNVTALMEKSIKPTIIDANATRDFVKVNDVPGGATIYVYDIESNSLLEQVKNNDSIVQDIEMAIPGLKKDQKIEVSIQEIKKLESDRVFAIAYFEPSDRIKEEDIVANATKNIVSVKNVPPYATVIVYDNNDSEIGQATNNSALNSNVEITADPSLIIGEIVRVTLTEEHHDESDPTDVVALEQSAPIAEERIIAFADTSTVVIKDIPANAEVFIYKDNGDLIGSKKNNSGQTNDLSILTDEPLTHLQEIRVTICEINKLESEYTETLARSKSSAPKMEDVFDIDVDNGTVKMGYVPAGAKVIIYDENENEQNFAVNGSMTTGEVLITDIDLQSGVFKVTYTEVDKLESDALTVQVDETTYKLIDDAIKDLEIEYNPGDTWESVTLPIFVVSIGKHNTIVEWESSHPTVVEMTEPNPLDHKITAKVYRQEKDTSVILTATVSKNGVNKVRTFLVIVKAAGLNKSVDVNSRTVVVTNGDEGEVSQTVSIDRITMTDGAKISKIDKVVFDNVSAQNFASNPDTENKVAQLNVLLDKNDEADEIAVEIPNATLDILTVNGNDLEIKTDNGTLMIQHAVIADMTDSYLDLYFRLVPVKDADRQREINDNVVNESEVRKEAGSRMVEVIGSSLQIETNYAGYPTKLFIPFESNHITVPSQNVDKFLQSLRVFIEHSDGDKVVKMGIPVYDGGTPIGLTIDIDKFSVFTIIQLKDVPYVPPMTMPSNSGDGSKQVLSGYVGLDQQSIIVELDSQDYVIDKTGFSGMFDGKSIAIKEVIVDGNQIIIYLHNPIPAGYKVTLNYQPKDSMSGNILRPFSDLPISNTGYHTAYINGYPDGTFRPENMITRAEMAAILVRALGLSDDNMYLQLYPDVAQSHWAVSYIEQLKQLGLMIGDAKGYFRPDDPITRAEMATIAARWLQIDTNVTFTSLYPDVTDSHWAAGAILAINQAGIMIGYPDGSFGPNDFVTRAQAVTILNRLLGRYPYDGVNHSTWPDVSLEHWAIGHIEEASNSHFFMYGDHDNEELRFAQGE